MFEKDENGQQPLPFVHAPSRLTIFLCDPMCIRIFNSDCRSLCSTSSAPSVFNTKKNDNQVDDFTPAFFSLERKILLTHNYDLKQANTQLDLLYQGVDTATTAVARFQGQKLSV